MARIALLGLLPVAAAVSASASAATSHTVVSILVPGYGIQSVLGSVVSANPTATTFALNCPSNADPTNCGLGPDPVTVVQGPSTYEVHSTESNPAQSVTA